MCELCPPPSEDIFGEIISKDGRPRNYYPPGKIPVQSNENTLIHVQYGASDEQKEQAK